MLKWIKIDIKASTEMKPPFFMGSMLRGALGVALKRVVCINPKYICENCFASKECLYFEYYEDKNVFHKFRLGITLAAENFNFSLYLFEDAVSILPYMLSTIKKTFEEVGFGKEHKVAKISSIYANDTLVYNGTDFLSLETVIPNHLEIDTFCQEVILEFTMPLRIKEANKIAGESIQLYTLINNIHSRYLQIKGEETRKLGYKVQGEIVKSTLKFVDTERYSNRQRSKMNMGGLKGMLHIKGLDKQSYVYLKIGEVISAGKQTVFGLGSYTLKEVK